MLAVEKGAYQPGSLAGIGERVEVVDASRARLVDRRERSVDANRPSAAQRDDVAFGVAAACVDPVNDARAVRKVLNVPVDDHTAPVPADRDGEKFEHARAR